MGCCIAIEEKLGIQPRNFSRKKKEINDVCIQLGITSVTSVTTLHPYQGKNEIELKHCCRLEKKKVEEVNLTSRHTFKITIGKSSNLNAMLQTNTKAYENVKLIDNSKYVHKWRLF